MKTDGVPRKIDVITHDTSERFVDVRLAVQVLRDLGRVHAAGEYLASLNPELQEGEHEAAADAFDQATSVLDEYPSAVLWALASEVQRQLGALPGSELEGLAVGVRGCA